MNDVFRATVLAKPIYCASAWYGFCLAADRERLDTFLQSLHANVFLQYLHVGSLVDDKVSTEPHRQQVESENSKLAKV